MFHLDRDHSPLPTGFHIDHVRNHALPLEELGVAGRVGTAGETTIAIFLPDPPHSMRLETWPAALTRSEPG
jgi:hypothetical protein